MTRQEAAIVTAYTGICIGDFSDFHEYAEKILGRPIFTHEFANKEIKDQIKNASRDDFISINVEDLCGAN